MSDERPTRQRATLERHREAARQIREELERIRKAEARIAESLGSLRAARARVEELSRSLAIEDQLVREVVREELRKVIGGRAPEGASDDEREAGAPGGVASLFESGRPGSDASEESDDDEPPRGTRAGERKETPEADEDRRDVGRSLLLVGVAAVSVVVVAGVAWLGFSSFRDGVRPDALTLAGDVAPGQEPEGVARDGAEAAREDSVEDAERAVERFFIMLPDDARQKAAVYDSLFRARSPLFRPLLDTVADLTSESRVRQAVGEWGEGSLTPLGEDLLRAAIVQYVLRSEVDGDLALDGQLLRNPCRGEACSALLNLWETRGEEYGLPAVPDDAPLDTDALRMAEGVVVLRRLENLYLDGS